MNSVLKNSFIISLLTVAFNTTYADDSSNKTLEAPINTGQYVLPPPSPFFSSNITSLKTFKDKNESLSKAAIDSNSSLTNEAESSEEPPLGSNNLKDRIHELELALKDNQQQTTNLVDELHATAKNADFENEMYEKTVSLLQDKIKKLGDGNKSLTSKLSSMETNKDQQQGLLSTIEKNATELDELKNSYKQRKEEVSSLKKQITYFKTLREKSSVTELDELKNSYQQRKEEVSSLKKQITYFETLREKSNVTNATVKTLENAYTLKSKEVEDLKIGLKESDTLSTALQEKVDEQTSEIDSLKQKVITEEQTQAELVDLQNAFAESNDSNVLLKAKIIELDDENKSLISQLNKIQQDASQQTRKLGLLDQSTAELEALKSAYKERNNEAANLKEELIEIDDSNKSLLAEIETMKADTNQNIRKLGILDQTTAELTALKSTYKERSNEATELKEKVTELDNSNKTLLSKIQQLENDASQSQRKLVLMEQSSAELTALKSTYKERNDEASALKEKVVELEISNKTLLSKTKQLENDASQSQRKLALMEQSSAQLTALKSAYKERNDEAVTLKEKVVALDDLNKTLQSKIQTLESEVNGSKRKLTLMDKAFAELTALKSAYKERNDEAQSLKDKLVVLDNDKKTLFSQLEKMKADTSQQSRKLGLLDQSTAELSALKSAYKDRNDETIELKKKLLDSDKNKKTLSDQLTQLNADNLSLQNKISDLEKMSAELAALQSSNKKLSDENAELTVTVNQQRTLTSSLESSTSELSQLKKKLNDSENLRKTLSSKINTLETNSSNQKRQLTTLSVVTQELASLKSAYKDLKNEKLAISNKLTTAMLDTDKDGVINELDQCPSSALGSSVDNIGCPEISDADGDNIPDANDLCANTANGANVNQFGCAADKNITLDGVNFAIGSDRLTLNSLSIINTVANALKANPSIKVEVAGHTDNSGISSVNQKLSKRRANAVAIQLIEQGVDASRISTKGLGESSPITSNNSEEGRLKNRRVELKIL